MIKVSLRKDLIYLLILCIVSFFRTILSILISSIFNFNGPYILLFLMTLGILFGSLTLNLYHANSFRKKKEIKYLGIGAIRHIVKIKNKDGYIKKGILIFFAGFFDFYEYILFAFYVPLIAKISVIFEKSMGCVSTITSSLICIYALRFKIGKHHKFSLISLGICLCLSLIIEIIYLPEDQLINKFLFAYFLLYLYRISLSLTDCIERYLVEYDFLNPFRVLMIEGIIEFFISIFYSINNAPFQEFQNQYKKNRAGKFTLLIFFLILYLLLSALLNVYKIYCNCFYTPMARSLTNYFLNPFFNIYYFISGKDYQKNFIHFFMIEIICILADFFCCVYNEFIIVNCCGLEYDTKDVIINRAIEEEMNEMINLNKEDEDDKTSYEQKNILYIFRKKGFY